MSDRRWTNQHVKERQSWATAWFLSLLDARKRKKAREADRASQGLSALGIHVVFDEDLPDDASSSAEPGHPRRPGGADHE